MSKLFVWENVLTDYSPGIAFAIANSAEEARVLIKNAYINDMGDTNPEFEEELEKPPQEITNGGFYLSGGG